MSMNTRTRNSFLKPAAALVVCLGLATQLGSTPAQAGGKGAILFGAGVVTGIVINEAIKHNSRPGPRPRPYTGPRRRNPPPARARTTVRRYQISRAEARRIQTALNTLGYEAGVVDGIIGPGTRSAIRTFQIEMDDNATGVLTAKQKIVLYDRASVAEAKAENETYSDAGSYGDDVDDADYVADLDDDDDDEDDDDDV